MHLSIPLVSILPPVTRITVSVTVANRVYYYCSTLASQTKQELDRVAVVAAVVFCLFIAARYMQHSTMSKLERYMRIKLGIASMFPVVFCLMLVSWSYYGFAISLCGHIIRDASAIQGNTYRANRLFALLYAIHVHAFWIWLSTIQYCSFALRALFAVLALILAAHRLLM